MHRFLKILAGFLPLAVGGGILFCGRSERLPRIPLQGGGEFCVVKICYGLAEVHRVGGSPRVVLRLWERLPRSWQDRLPAPTYGDTGLSPGANRNALSIYWTWIEPNTGKREIGPSGSVTMTMDSGDQVKLNSPYPFDDINGDGYRQIFVDEPSRNSRFLRFHVPVEEEAVDFSISNPAFGKP